MRFAVESPHLLFMPQTSLIWRHDDDDDDDDDEDDGDDDGDDDDGCHKMKTL